MSKAPEKMDANGDVLTVIASKQLLRQVWFPGDHGSLGGGELRLDGLSDGSLIWMMKQIEGLGLGLELDPSRIPFPPDLAKIDYKTPFFRIDWLMIPGIIWREINHDAIFERDIHESVKLRWRDLADYRPKNLAKRFGKELEEWVIQNKQ
jgi:hypothetical protein